MNLKGGVVGDEAINRSDKREKINKNSTLVYLASPKNIVCK